MPLRKSYGTHTVFGRNIHAMRWIREKFRGKPKTIAWVIGIGGGSRAASTPTEHIEVASMLHQAGVKDFHVFGCDINRMKMLTAAKNLKDGKLKLARPNLSVDEQTALSQHSQSIFGPKAWRPNGWFEIPEAIRRRITLLKPPEGNIFQSMPAKQPDLITIFNSAGYYDKKRQEKLAENFAEALAPGGTIVTNNNSTQIAFVYALQEAGLEMTSVDKPPGLGYTYIDRILVFTKKPLTRKRL
ncbi:MAG: hypothetical protein V1811_00140 [Candidatus Micrarchaeota archaeon]